MSGPQSRAKLRYEPIRARRYGGPERRKITPHAQRQLTRQEYEQFAQLLSEKRRRQAKAQHKTRGYRDEHGIWRGGLIEFVRDFWHILEPGTTFRDGWALEAICEHLEAVTFGEVTRLLMNVPPGFMKSLLTDVFWPAWEWGPMELAHLRYVTFSYSSMLTERDNLRFKDLITSPDYQAMYGDVVKVRKTGETKVSNWKHGWKLASSVGGVGTGERGDRAIIDDPHNVKESESKLVRQETIRWFRESLSSRLNDMVNGAKVVIMQRVNEEDVSGEIIANMDDWCHLLIPMEYVWEADENGEPIATQIGWTDPRWRPNIKDCEGELAWPERFPESIIPQMKKDAGKFAWASQYQQTPETRGGAIFEREWWQPWEPTDGKFPAFSYIIASVDSAFGNKENADPSAMVVLGIFENEHGYNRVMLIEAWRKNVKFSGPKMQPKPGEKGLAFEQRKRKSWGLIEWVADTCTRRQVDHLLIENKASGASAAQSLAVAHPNAGWASILIEPKGDKWSRAQSVQPTFSQEMVYVPVLAGQHRQWAQDVIDEMAIFPKGKHDDLTDAMTQGIKFLRDRGLLRQDNEVRQEKLDAVKVPPKQKPIYPGTRQSAGF